MIEPRRAGYAPAMFGVGDRVLVGGHRGVVASVVAPTEEFVAAYVVRFDSGETGSYWERSLAVDEGAVSAAWYSSCVLAILGGFSVACAQQPRHVWPLVPLTAAVAVWWRRRAGFSWLGTVADVALVVGTGVVAGAILLAVGVHL